MLDVLTQLADPNLLALQIRGEQWPRSYFATTLIPDAWMALLESSEGWRKLVPAGEDPRPDAEARLTLVRNRAIVVPLEARDLTTSGSEDLALDGELLVRWPARDDDLAALALHLRGSSPGAPGSPSSTADSRLTSADFAKRLAPALHEALRDFARTHSAADLLNGDARETLAAFLRERLHRTWLEWGLALERINRLYCTSRVVTERTARERDAARRVEQIQSRQLVEQAALAATQQRVSGLRTTFDKLREAAGGDTRSWRELLPALDPAERARLLTSLWRLTPQHERTTAIAAVSATRCIVLDARDPERVLRRIDLPPDLGPLRSVIQAPPASGLFIGATRGLWRVKDDGTPPSAYPAPEPEAVRHRFNSMLLDDSGGSNERGGTNDVGAAARILSTNTQLGCCAWSLADPADFQWLFTPATETRSVRGLCCAAERVFFVADNRVMQVTGDSAAPTGPPAGSTIHSLAATEETLYATWGDGSIQRLSLDDPHAWEVVERLSSPAASLALRTWGGVVELIVPDGRRGLVAIYPDERITVPVLHAPATFAGQPAPLQRAWAAPDTLVGLNQDLGRLYIRTLDQSDDTQREVLLSRLLSGAVEDVALVTETTALPAQS